MKTIYVNGDSFPAGAELADHLLIGWPGYTDNRSFSTENAKKWNEIRPSRLNLYPGGPAAIHIKEKQYAWPNIIAEKYNINVVNSAKSGASVLGIAKRTCVDLLELTNRGVIVDKVFVQLTTLDRTEFYKNTPDNRHFDDLPLTNLLTADRNAVERKLATAYLDYNDADLAAKFLYGILFLEQTVKNLTGLSPIYLSTGLSEYSLTLINSTAENFPSIKRLLNLTSLHSVDFNNKPMNSIHVENDFLLCPAGHYEQRTHVIFAEELYDKYIR